MLIEIFKTGTHTDASGNSRRWTEQDLDAIVAKYNPAEHEAPVVIGHPKDNAPAYGWVESLERRGKSLWAKIRPTVQEFVDWVRQGVYKKVSISLYPDLLLRHIGFLGAMPPAVKGLKLPEFSDSDYSEYVIDHKEVNMDEKLKELEEKLKEKETTLSEFLEKDRAKDEELAKLRAELDSERTKQRRAEFMAVCERLIQEGKLTPAQKPVVVDFMEILHSVAEYEFSEGDGKIKAKPVERFIAFLGKLPKQVEFSEMVTKDRATDETKKKDFKEMTGWELIELYKTDRAAFDEAVSKI